MSTYMNTRVYIYMYMYIYVYIYMYTWIKLGLCKITLLQFCYFLVMVKTKYNIIK